MLGWEVAETREISFLRCRPKSREREREKEKRERERESRKASFVCMRLASKK